MIQRIGDCGRVRCEPGWHLAPAWSAHLKDHDLWFVWAGHGRMTLRQGQTVDLRPGICIWARPGGRYLATQSPTDRLGVTYIHFQPEAGLPNPAEVHDVAAVGYFDALTQRIVSLHQSDDDAIALPLLSGLVLDMLHGRCTRLEAPAATERRHEEIAHRAAAAIREAPGTLDVAALAAEAGYSPDHFTRVFTQVIGRTPRDYAITRRIERARVLLDETALPVSQIADALGYDTPAFFCRQFKEQTGVTPGGYRTQARAY